MGASEPDFDAVEKPMPSLGELAAEENLDGLSAEQLETFERGPSGARPSSCGRLPS